MRDGVEDLLDRAVGWYEPSSDALERVQRRAIRRRASRRAAVAAFALALSVAAGLLTWAAFRPPGGQTPGGNETPSPTPSTASSALGVGRIACTHSGTQLLTPSVQVQPNGVHFAIENPAGASMLDVFPELWGDGVIGQDFGGSNAEVLLEVPPGRALVACVPKGGGPRPDSLDELKAAVPIQIDDPSGVWKSDILACGVGEREELERSDLAAYVSVNPIATDLEKVLRRAIPGIPSSDQVGPAGYPNGDQRTRQWRVIRDGGVIALIRYPSSVGGAGPSLELAQFSPVVVCAGSGIGEGETAGLLATPFEIPKYAWCDPYSEECSLVYVTAERYRQLGGRLEPEIVVSEGSTQCFQDGISAACEDQPPGSFWYALRMMPTTAARFEQVHGCGASLRDICR